MKFRCVVLIGREFTYEGPWHDRWSTARDNGRDANRVIANDCNWPTNWFVQDSEGNSHHQEPKA